MNQEKEKQYQQIDRRNKAIWERRYSHGREALVEGQEVLRQAEALGYIEGKAEALVYTGLLRYWFDEDANYLSDLLFANDLLNNSSNKVLLSRLNSILAGVYDQFGDYEKALDLANKAICFAREMDAKSELSDAITMQGQVFLRLEDHVQATLSFQQALDLRRELNDRKAQASSLNLLARCQALRKDFLSALEYYHQALEVREKDGDRFGLPWTYLGLADVAFQQGDFELAKNYYLKGLELNLSISDLRYEVLCRKGLGEIYQQTKETEKSEAELLSALEKAEQIKIKPLQADLNKLLAGLYEIRGNFSKAYPHLKLYSQLKEEILNNESANRIRNQQIAFSVEETRQKAEIYQLRNVELKNAIDIVEEKNRQITDSINYARRIQAAVFPPDSLIKSALPKSFIVFLPKDIVSGDFYWINSKSDKLFFANADCTGHGVPGAFMSLISKISLDRALHEFNLDTPSDILTKLGYLLADAFKQSETDVKDGMDIALCSFDKKSSLLSFAGARHPLYLLRGEELIMFKGDRNSIEGNWQEISYTNHQIQLRPGDRLYIFSDGYIDQFGGEENRKFLQKNFRELLLETRQMGIEEQGLIVLDRFNKWKGSYEQIDDVSVIGIEI
ncbi:MAG: tetratricopeptide repeat protein [Bacteroidota bacterium]|nr:MAG: tetratricopeptide repeat protein [Bacteroidota bacterium]